MLLLAATLSACSSHGHPPSASKAAINDLEAIQRGDCARVESRLNADMRSRLTAQAMCADYRTYLATFGAFVGHGTPEVINLGANDVVQVPLRLANSNGEFRVTYDADGHISGLYFLRPGVPL
jgi:hypothetical protein